MPSNYNDMSDNNCGMIKQDWDVDKKCGVCGVRFFIFSNFLQKKAKKIFL